MKLLYDDNFGCYDMGDDREEREAFYHRNQRRSVKKTCSICGRTVRLLPEYDKCNRCMTILENGGDPQ